MLKGGKSPQPILLIVVVLVALMACLVVPVVIATILERIPSESKETTTHRNSSQGH
jgi:Tfp pilus assembly protein FimT